jgi:hypothetical protein
MAIDVHDAALPAIFTYTTAFAAVRVVRMTHRIR